MTPQREWNKVDEQAAGWLEGGIDLQRRWLSIGDGDGEVDARVHERAVRGLVLLEAESQEPINLWFNSCGGDFYHGMGIYDVMTAMRSPIRMVVTGYACSVGSVILQAADTRIMGPHAILMIHDGMETLSTDPKSFDAWSKQMAQSRAEMYGAYWKRMRAVQPDLTMKDIEELCSHDTVYSARQAVDAGLADHVLGDPISTDFARTLIHDSTPSGVVG